MHRTSTESSIVFLPFVLFMYKKHILGETDGNEVDLSF